MQALRLPARQGVQWLVSGIYLFRSNPLLLTSLTVLYLLAVLLMASVPYLGMALASLARPVLTLVVANGCRAIDHRRSRPLAKGALLNGVEANQTQLIRLGGLYLLGSLLVLILNALLAGGDVDMRRMSQQEMTLALMKMMALAMIVELPFWFTPLLVGWGGVSAGKSLFFSLIAVQRNWRPFAAYGLTLGAGVALLASLVLGISELFGSNILAGILFLLLGLFMSFVLTPVLMASVYLGYRDVFAVE
ncbi:MAG TPA: BPSS1780 family membrane protein [Rhodocyclaceae bacterium]